MAKYKNIVGTGFPDYVAEQFKTRQKLLENRTRTSTTLQFLTNRNSFIRLSSGVDMADNDGKYTSKFAKENILQGGTISSNNNQITIKKGFSETYTQGTTDNLGFKPMPGITNLSVNTGGKWQTMMQASVEFVCYDLDQLDIMSKLYMSLGCTVFLEWGHVPYLKEDGKLENNPTTIDFFNSKFTKRDEVLKEVNKLRRTSQGNYEALIGRVNNFDWTANKDGSYNCIVKIMGPGQMAESLKVNAFANQDYDDSPTIEPLKYTSALGNALIAIKKFIEKSGIANSIELPTGIISLGAIPLPIQNPFGTKIKSSNLGSTGETFFDPIEEGGESYADLLNRIYSDCLYNGPTFDLTNKSVVYPNNNTSYGNAHQLISNLAEGNDGLEKIPLSFYNGYCTVQRDDKFDTEEETKSTYITLGHLFTLIQHMGIASEGPTEYTNSSKDFTPVIYLDYHPDNTLISRGPLEASIDPSTSLIPLSVSDRVVNDEKFSGAEAQQVYFSPLNTYSSDTKRKWSDSVSEIGNKSKNLLLTPQFNKVNAVLGNSFEGKLFNILVNIDFAINTLKSLSNKKDTSVSLLSYIQAILDGINLSLGQVNNLRTFFDDNSGCIRIVDEITTEKLDPEKLLVIPNFGEKSQAYDYGFNSRISPNLAAQIIISTQAEDSGGIKEFSEDILTYQKLNGGVKDRFSQTIIPGTKYKREVSDEKGSNEKALQALFDHLFLCYSYASPDNIPFNSVSSLTNTYKELQNTQKKFLQKSYGSVLVPLEYNITLDGISGILPYNVFLVPDDRLPKKYKDKAGKSRVCFAVFSINHSFVNNRWLTNLRGQTLLIDKPFIKEILPSPTTAPSISGGGIGPFSTTSTEADVNYFRNKKQAINLLKASSIKLGLFTPNSIATVIAIAAGESDLIPQSENINYTPERLRSTFPNLTEDQYNRCETAIRNKNKVAFFNIVYGEYAPQRVGNTSIEDGGKFYGRGFFQLTGRSNYERYNRFTSGDIVSNPELANNPQIASDLAAAFVFTRARGGSESRDFLESAIAAVGGRDDVKAKKRRYHDALINNYEELVGN